MTYQKKVIIDTRKNLVEATVYNRSEVVEHLQQHNWHLNAETFVRVAPDEYCLVSKTVLTPDMDIVDEKLVCAWSTAETAELKELRKYKARGFVMGKFLLFDTIALCIVAVATMFTMWSNIDIVVRCAIFVVFPAFVCLHVTIIDTLLESKSDTKNSGK